jgi:hypothetical protein
MYIRQAKTADCDWLTSNPYIVAVNCGATRSSAAATENQTVCQPSAITNITYSTVGVSSLSVVTVDNLPNGVTYSWTNNTLTISGSPTSSGTFVYRVSVCGVAAASGTITVYPAFNAGAITTASGTTTPGTNPNVTIANASSATGGDGNITYQWRRSGTSSATLNGSAATYALSADAASNYGTAGTYYFKRYAKHSSCNSAFTASSGQYTLTVLCPTPPFSGCETWTYGTQTWSGALSNPVSGCTSTSSLSTSDSPPAQYRNNGTTYGYYYNWTCVNNNAIILCPSPWHVPTNDEFYALIANTTSATLIEDWGLPGYATGSDVYAVDNTASFWSSTNTTDGKSSYLDYYAGNVIVSEALWYRGFQIKCVR